MTTSNSNNKNRNISVITRFEEVIQLLSEIVVILEEYPNLHYRKEYVYNLRSLTKEIQQELHGGHFSLEYIYEKSSKLWDCARIIKNER